MSGPPGKRDAAGEEVPQPRCIVWLAPGRPAPRPLLHGLARRGVAAVLAHDAPSVMRELAAAPTLVVIITEPHEQPRLSELCAAMRRYYPRTRLWEYQARGAPGGAGEPARPRLAKMNGVADSRPHHDDAAPADERGEGLGRASGDTGDEGPRAAHEAHDAPAAHDAHGAPDSHEVHAPQDGGERGREEQASATGAEVSDEEKADDGAAWPSTPSSGGPGRQPPPPLSSLTAQELAMLLGTDEEGEQENTAERDEGTRGESGRPPGTDRQS